MTFGDKIISTYRSIYSLPELDYQEQISPASFQIYKKKHSFVVVTIYNSEKEILLIRDFNKNIGWELPGGYIYEHESLEEAVNRIINTETGLEIDELEPIAMVNNNFHSEAGDISHNGVAFMALSRGEIHPLPQNITTQFFKEFPEKVAYQNISVLEFAKMMLGKKEHEPPYGEIESIKSKKFFLMSFFHSSIIKPIGSLSSRKIKRSIISLISGNPTSILDASCGDSAIINDLCALFKPDICIGNDISWKTISMMKHKNSDVIFTNHNVLELPYKSQFDLIVFKNTLHHIDKKHQGAVVKSLAAMAKQLIIVDIDDPQKSSWLSRMWNNYYVYILGDQGDSFLNFDQFKEMLTTTLPDRKYTTGFINTIKGRYFFASIT